MKHAMGIRGYEKGGLVYDGGPGYANKGDYYDRIIDRRTDRRKSESLVDEKPQGLRRPTWDYSRGNTQGNIGQFPKENSILRGSQSQRPPTGMGAQLGDEDYSATRKTTAKRISVGVEAVSGVRLS